VEGCPSLEFLGPLEHLMVLEILEEELNIHLAVVCGGAVYPVKSWGTKGRWFPAEDIINVNVHEEGLVIGVDDSTIVECSAARHMVGNDL
jgi:hypothetical protein